jgi:hypothetical protein
VNVAGHATGGLCGPEVVVVAGQISSQMARRDLVASIEVGSRVACHVNSAIGGDRHLAPNRCQWCHIVLSIAGSQPGIWSENIQQAWKVFPFNDPRFLRLRKRFPPHPPVPTLVMSTVPSKLSPCANPPEALYLARSNRDCQAATCHRAGPWCNLRRKRSSGVRRQPITGILVPVPHCLSHSC